MVLKKGKEVEKGAEELGFGKKESADKCSERAFAKSFRKMDEKKEQEVVTRTHRRLCADVVVYRTKKEAKKKGRGERRRWQSTWKVRTGIRAYTPE